MTKCRAPKGICSSNPYFLNGYVSLRASVFHAPTDYPQKTQYSKDPNNDTKDFAHLASPSIGDHLSTTNSEIFFRG